MQSKFIKSELSELKKKIFFVKTEIKKGFVIMAILVTGVSRLGFRDGDCELVERQVQLREVVQITNITCNNPLHLILRKNIATVATRNDLRRLLPRL